MLPSYSGNLLLCVWHICEYMPMYIYTCVHVYAHVCGGLWTSSGVSPSCSPPYFPAAWSVGELGDISKSSAVQLSGQQASEICWLPVKQWWLQAHSTRPDFYMGAEYLTSGPHWCKLSTLPLHGPSLHSLDFVYFNIHKHISVLLHWGSGAIEKMKQSLRNVRI